jgi:cysteine-rich repeat protein
MRFDSAVLPRATIIDAAWLELPITAAGGPVSIHRVLETWSEDASGDVSFDPAPLARFYADEDRTILTVDEVVSAWLRDPTQDFGLALVGEGTATSVAAREATEAPPFLSLAYHMAGDSGSLIATTHPCGNGVLDGNEECDDADDDDLDGCTNACRLARCGDNLIRRHVEDCDDGNTVPDDGCSADCLRCADPAATATYLGQNGHCYAWYATPARSFTTSENLCDFGGHAIVASFETLAEQSEVVAGLGLTGQNVWIGLSDRGTEGDYRWVSGPAATYTDWAAMEPTGAAEDCVALNGNANWVDDVCSAGRGFVCERTPWLIGADGHAYRDVVGAGLDFVVASSDCQTIGAELMTVSGAAENLLVAGRLGFDSWMGLTEIGHDGTLAWASGEALAFENFPAGIPNLDGAEFCVRLLTSGTWQVAACANNSRYVCESR